MSLKQDMWLAPTAAQNTNLKQAKSLPII